MFDWLKKQRDNSDCGLGSPVMALEKQGLLSQNFLAAHVNYLWDNDARILATHRASVVHCPRSHAYFQHTRFPFQQLQKAGVDLSKRETVQAVVDQMNELVAQMEVEAEKIR